MSAKTIGPRSQLDKLRTCTSMRFYISSMQAVDMTLRRINSKFKKTKGNTEHFIDSEERPFHSTIV